MERSGQTSPIPSTLHEPGSMDQLPSPPPPRPDAASQPPSHPHRSGKKFLAIGAAVLPVAGAITRIALAGVNVKFRTVSQSGYVGSRRRFTAGWGFHPKCDHGACSVVWKDVREKSLKTTLRRKSGNYSSSDTGKFLGHCGHVMGTTTV